jgi:NAD+ synthase (glutamine-hydrolysing)
MRLSLAQINPTIGDIAGNAAKIVEWIGRARAAHADLVVFPELCLSGYPPKDLILQEGFVDRCVSAAKEIGEKHTAGLTVVFGTPLPVDAHNPDAKGSGVANALLAYRDGIFIDYYDKRLLPTYDVFDEDRYFVPGDRAVVIDVPVGGRGTALPGGVPCVWRVGLSICEDLWRGEDVGFSHRYHGRKDPVAELCAPQPGGKPGATLIINPSASPFVMGKGRRHRDILIKHATANRVFVAAVNQVGGNDELIFDGHAALYAPGGTLLSAGPGFKEDLITCDIPDTQPPASALNTQHSALPTDPLLSTPDEQLLYEALVLGIRDYCRKTGFKSAVLGLSGGIDSAVTAVLAAAALGPQHVLGVSLPSRFSSDGSKSDASELAHRLGMPMITIPIEPAHSAMLGMLSPAFEEARAGATRFDASTIPEENIQSRIRGTVLMGLSNKLGHILLTTGNKSEMAVGYATLYGDMAGGFSALKDVPKTLVYRLAEYRNSLGPGEGPIPVDTIVRAPSAELAADQKDQDTLPPYDVLDHIIESYVVNDESVEEIVASGVDRSTVQRSVNMIDGNEYKRRQAAPGVRITPKAFGKDRRLPITNRYRG